MSLLGKVALILTSVFSGIALLLWIFKKIVDAIDLLDFENYI